MSTQSDSPTRIERTISIDAPQADIYSFLAAPESIAEYWPGIALTADGESTALAYAPPPEAVIPPFTLSVDQEVSEQTAPTSLTMAFEGELEGSVTWQLQETGGSTQVQIAAAYTSVGATDGAPSKIPVRNGGEPLKALQETLPGVLAEVLATLKQLCEQPSPPAQMVANLEIPDIECPFEPVPHPSQEQVIAQSMEWAQEIEMIDKPTPERRTSALWPTLAYPSASFTESCFISDWSVWVFLADDELESIRHPASIKRFQAPMLEILDGKPVDESHSPRVRAFGDLIQRAKELGTPFWYKRFVQHHRVFFKGNRWTAHNRAYNHVPSRDRYLQGRREELAGDIGTDFVTLHSDLTVTPSLYNTDTYQAIRTSVQNIIGWTNDVYSLRKELADDAVNNLVLSVRKERNCSFEEAVSVICGMVEDEIRRFEALCQQLLEERDESDALRAHLRDFSELIAGDQKWEPKTVRHPL